MGTGAGTREAPWECHPPPPSAMVEMPPASYLHLIVFGKCLGQMHTYLLLTEISIAMPLVNFLNLKDLIVHCDFCKFLLLEEGRTFTQQFIFFFFLALVLYGIQF